MDLLQIQKGIIYCDQSKSRVILKVFAKLINLLLFDNQFNSLTSSLEKNSLFNVQNPKLLSQFVSPHTGHVYQSHITGLCSYMQVQHNFISIGITPQRIMRSRMSAHCAMLPLLTPPTCCQLFKNRQ